LIDVIEVVREALRARDASSAATLKVIIRGDDRADCGARTMTSVSSSSGTMTMAFFVVTMNSDVARAL
jgi:hypothetical protein